MLFVMVEIPDKEYKKFWDLLKEKTNLEDIETRSTKVVREYENKNEKITESLVKEKMSEILIGCIILEKEKWELTKTSIRQNWIDILNGHESEFPTITSIVNNAAKHVSEESNNVKKIHAAIRDTESLSSRISTSLDQSAKNRAGKSFEFHIKNCINKIGMTYESQVEVHNEKPVYDLVFPNKQHLENNGRGSAVMENQSTLKDRFRLTQGRGKNVRLDGKFLATGSGLGIVVKKDKKDLTKKKLAELKKNNVILIVFKKVSEEKNDSYVISFEDFVNNEYPRFSKMWN